MSSTFYQELSQNIRFEESDIEGARIKVVGIGGGGNNAVNRMIEAGIEGIEFIAANTDRQALAKSNAPVKIQLGGALTKGLGAGADPKIGHQAALESTEHLIERLQDADMVFITCGLGGGTGTGAAPVIASLASELGALVVAVVTKPFNFEGRRRMQQAEQGFDELEEAADTVITIPNQKLLSAVAKNTSFTDAFKVADDVLRQAVQGISDLVTIPGLINLDFADVRSVMTQMGMALMGTGYATGENRARLATEQAINSPLLDDVTIKGSRSVLINITGGPDLTLFEINEAASLIREAVDEDANIIFGAVINEHMSAEMKITVIATGFERSASALTPGNLPTANLQASAAAAAEGALSGIPGNQKINDPNTPAYLRRMAPTTTTTPLSGQQ
ncbi:MAG: cell division protein FtsZ [Pyrinomonadaceae bacterium]